MTLLFSCDMTKTAPHYLDYFERVKLMAKNPEACQRLSEFVKDLRGRRKLSRRKFAKSLAISYASIRVYEKGEGFPNSRNLSILAQEANITVDELLRYLQYGDNGDNQKSPRPKRAEDVLFLINEELSPGETVRLIELLAQELAAKV